MAEAAATHHAQPDARYHAHAHALTLAAPNLGPTATIGTRLISWWGSCSEFAQRHQQASGRTSATLDAPHQRGG